MAPHGSRKVDDDTTFDALRRMNKVGADPMIPSLDRRQSRYHQRAQLSNMIRRSASADLSLVEPSSRQLRPPSTSLRPAPAYGRGSNSTRPLSGIQEAAEASLAERLPSYRGPSHRSPSHRRPAKTDGAADNASRRLKPNTAAPTGHSVLTPPSLPERKSSRRLFLAYSSKAPGLSVDRPSLIPAPPSESGQTISSHGHPRSSVAALATLDPIDLEMRRNPSRTFVRSVRPTDILEFPRIHHARVVIEMRTPTPIFMGGGTVEGQLHLAVDGGLGQGCRKSKPTVSFGRISVDVLGVEELSSGKRWIFRTLATELIDQAHPPPSVMVASSVPLADAFWELVPSATWLPFRLNLPVNMGPPPYYSKSARIRYVLCTSVLIKVAGETFQVRESQDISILSVHDPEKTLINLPDPLTAYDELEVSRAGEVGIIKITAGLHRQTWLSGMNIWVDVHISNMSQRTVRKMEVHLEKVTLFYNHSGASSLAEDAVHLRLPDRKDNETVSRWVLKKSKRGWKGVVPKSNEVRTVEVDVPRGLVTVHTGRYFEVCYFLKIHISSRISKLLTVQLPVTIIHPNSVDIVPNLVAQVAAVIEDTPGYGVPTRESTTRFSQGRAFTAARKQSLSQLTSDALPSKPNARLAHQLGASAQKIRRRRSTSDPAEYLAIGNTGDGLGMGSHSEHQHRRVQSSAEMKRTGPRTSTSSIQPDGLKSGDPSDFQTVGNTKFGTDGRPIQREPSQAHKRSSDRGSSSGWRNIALEEAENMAERRQIMWI